MTLACVQLEGSISRRTAASRSAVAGGFTLVEVMIAATVMILTITTAILTLQQGLRAVDAARGYTYASQVMQSELERLRLKSWAQIQEIQSSGQNTVAIPTGGMTVVAFSCQRTIRDLKTDMKEITLESSWRGSDGRPHSARFITRYSKTGLYDYFYTAH